MFYNYSYKFLLNLFEMFRFIKNTNKKVFEYNTLNYSNKKIDSLLIIF